MDTSDTGTGKLDQRFFVEFTATWWAWAKWLFLIFCIIVFLFTIATFFCVYHRDRGQHTLVSPNGEGYLGFTGNHINGLFVSPWHQKKGIGKELTRRFIRQTKQDHFTYDSWIWFDSDKIVYNNKIQNCKTKNGLRICPISDDMKKWSKSGSGSRARSGTL